MSKIDESEIFLHLVPNVKPVLADPEDICKGCIFDTDDDPRCDIVACRSWQRNDGQGVIFVLKDKHE